MKEGVMLAEILKIKFDDIEKIELIGGTKAKTLVNAVAGYSRKPDYVFNAGHFDNIRNSKTYGVTITDTIVNGKWINGGNYSSKIYQDRGIAFNDDGKSMKICSTETAKNEKYQSYLGGSPLLLENGVINKEYLKTAFAKAKTYRIAFGFNDSEIVVCFQPKCQTLMDTSNYLLQTGIKNAIALDGGGSLNVRKLNGTKYVHIDELNYNRAVSTFICIWLKKTTPATKASSDIPMYNGKKAIGVAEVIWQTVNRRAGSGVNYAQTGTLKKGDRITIFDQKNTWIESYGYWISVNAIKWVKKY